MISWPESFGQAFTVTVDTEEEFDWTRPLTREEHSVEAISALGEADRRLREAGADPAYMADWPVIASQRASATLRQLAEERGAIIGAQLHPWVNPPFDETLSQANSFPGNLPISLETTKLEILTEQIAKRIGRRPIAYRAGRYGLGPATLEILASLGYRLDSSMRARYDYSAQGGPNFQAIASHAFWTGPDQSILELPLTTVFTGAVRHLGARFDRVLSRLPHGHGIFARTQLFSRVALTPEDMPVADALEAIRVGLGEGVRILNFSFHSPTVVPGNTPYVRDAGDLARFYNWWDRVLELLAVRGARAVSMQRIVDVANAALASARSPA